LLGIIIQPEDFEQLMPKYLGGQHVKWPIDAAEQLRAAAKSAALDVRILDPATPFELENAVEKIDPLLPIEVVHYIGFGRVDVDGPKMALLDDDGGVLWRPAGDVFKRVARSNARLFVAQFITPPTGEEWEPIQPQTFLEALDGRVNAVVFNRVPIYAGRASWFNKELYKTIGSGDTVETAVREARRRLYRNPPPEDPASFAWYTVITGDKSDMQLLQAHASRPPTGGIRADAPVATPHAQLPRRNAEASPEGGRDALAR
jgi:cellobiose-specific phosphotransferase system component IIB